jgi:receptor-type tyrosine-protein phosphatase Q
VAPTNIRGLAIDHSSINLTWDAPPDILSNGIITAYIINVTERETGYTFERNSTDTTVILNSLHPDYVYECRVAAFTIAVGPFSTIFAVQVLMAGM